MESTFILPSITFVTWPQPRQSTTLLAWGRLLNKIKKEGDLKCFLQPFHKGVQHQLFSSFVIEHNTKFQNLNPFNMTIVQQGQGCPVQCARCRQAEEWRKQDISRELWATRFASTLQRFPTLQALWPRRPSSMAYPDFDPISPASSNASSPAPTPSGSRRRDAKNGQESKCT